MRFITSDFVLFVIAALLFYCIVIRSSREGFTREEAFFNDLIKLGGHMRLAFRIPLTQGEKAAICDVAARLPPPGGMPDAIRIKGADSPTSLSLGHGLTSEFDQYLPTENTLWMRQNKPNSGTIYENRNKNQPTSEEAYMLLTTRGTF